MSISDHIARVVTVNLRTHQLRAEDQVDFFGGRQALKNSLAISDYMRKIQREAIDWASR